MRRTLCRSFLAAGTAEFLFDECTIKTDRVPGIDVEKVADLVRRVGGAESLPSPDLGGGQLNLLKHTMLASVSSH